jgi:hypothetical protein
MKIKRKAQPPKPYRYRRDLTEDHFSIRHAFRKGFRKLEIEVLYSGSVFRNLYFPIWERYAPGEFRFLKTEFRECNISVISNTDVKRICNYIDIDKSAILKVFFDFAALPVLSAEARGNEYSFLARFRYEGINSYAFATERLIKKF